MDSELVRRLNKFLAYLDEKLQTEGLFPEEVEARAHAQRMCTTARVYRDWCGDSLFLALDPQDHHWVKVLRERTHSLESDGKGLNHLLRHLAAFERLQSEINARLQRLEDLETASARL